MTNLRAGRKQKSAGKRKKMGTALKSARMPGDSRSAGMGIGAWVAERNGLVGELEKRNAQLDDMVRRFGLVGQAGIGLVGDLEAGVLTFQEAKKIWDLHSAPGAVAGKCEGCGWVTWPTVSHCGRCRVLGGFADDELRSRAARLVPGMPAGYRQVSQEEIRQLPAGTGLKVLKVQPGGSLQDVTDTPDGQEMLRQMKEREQ